MAELKSITYSVVEETAAGLRSDNKELTQILTEIKTIINSLGSDFIAGASDTIQSKITGMQPKFDTYNDVIEKYAKFLDKAASEFKQTDDVLTRNAEQFP